jgi:hypothetical protein
MKHCSICGIESLEELCPMCRGIGRAAQRGAKEDVAEAEQRARVDVETGYGEVLRKRV